MRDSRRRRMMMRDENECEGVMDQDPDFESAADGASAESTAYTAGAKIENQPRMVDFIPTRVFLICGIFLALVAVVALLNVAHFKILPFAEAQGISAGGLELSLDRGLLSWVASFLLLATAFFCFQVFQVRRYRADDFTGSYRVWIWLALGFILASVDATARISPIAAKLISANWESGLLSVDRNVWFLLVGVPAGMVAMRLVVEIWRSRIAIGSISIASLAYIIANLVRMDFFPVSEPSHAVVEANSVAVAHSCLFFTIVCYSRFVMLESQSNQLTSSEASFEQSTMEVDPTVTGEMAGVTEEESANRPSKAKKSARKRPLSQKLAETSISSETESVSESEADEEEDQPTLKLMGQSVQKKKGKGKRKGSQQSRRRAA